MIKRINILSLLKNSRQREELMVSCIIAIQSREGINTTIEQAKKAYKNVRNEKKVLDRLY